MRYIDEYRDAVLVRSLAAGMRREASAHRVLMEICGGQTHTIVRYGLDEMLPANVELVHGPGCPVCVTAAETVDLAIEIASRPEVIFTSYGDMLRVPGSATDLFTARARGADVRVVYSPLDALKIAAANPERKVVFFAIGFETTAPAHAITVKRARESELRNFSLLASHVLVPPAIRLLLESPGNRVQGFIAPGHVCAVMGYWQYEAISREYRVPIVVGGFEPVDLMQAVHLLLRQLESGRAEVENQYARSVTREGNVAAQRVIDEVFEPVDRKWRGLGEIPRSGLRLRPEYGEYDAERIFGLTAAPAHEPPDCISGLVLQGRAKPADCPQFGRGCTPDRPLGAPMVSAEGACAAYFRYRRERAEAACPR